MVPTQLKMLSPSGNALIPASALVCVRERGRGYEGGSVSGGFAEGENLKKRIGVWGAIAGGSRAATR
ncbi:hypothetical protein N9L76_02750 [bacterium]|nr:hypothetical protein [bacterium]